MDNITHSLVGIALADALTGGRPAKAQRPLMIGAGIISANLPDIDIVYSAITPAPIGYLVHHRGHTHTIAGLAGLAVVLMLAYRWMPTVQALRTAERLRLWLIVTVGLASHLAMDALNNYGVHPWFPFENRWYYGDSVFIFEPALWIVLGVAAAWNGRSRASKLAASVPVLLVLAAVWVAALVPLESIALLALLGVVAASTAGRLSSRGRAVSALVVSAGIVAGLVTTSRIARQEAGRALKPHLRGQLVDIVLTPNPSAPLCWGVIGVESIESSREYVLWRGTLTLAPALKPATSCASHRVIPAGPTRVVAEGTLALGAEVRQSTERLRDLNRHDCWVRAWLRFGRVPVIARGQIFDLRFGDRGVGDFTAMSLVRGAGEPGCPPMVPRWEMPRRDLLVR